MNETPSPDSISSVFSPTLFEGEHFIVQGLGKNGLASALALQKTGALVSAWDDKEEARLQAIKLGVRCIDPDNWAKEPKARGLLLSPGIAHALPQPHRAAEFANSYQIPILTDTEILFGAVRKSGSKARFVGITGTNGKSTTTALTAHILKTAGFQVAFGGNLGQAALSLPLLDDDGIYVLEMSSYMLERLHNMHFDVACLLNISPDHLDRHGDMVGYIAAKLNIFANQTPQDCAVLGMDSEDSYRIAVKLQKKTAPLVTFSANIAKCTERVDFWADGKRSLRSAKQVYCSLQGNKSLLGQHNAQNALAALVMADYFGVPAGKINEAMHSFQGLDHRQKVIDVIDGVEFVDDSKGTNAEATSKALGSYRELIWIAGGVAKEGGIKELTSYLNHVRYAFLIGQCADEFAATLEEAGVPHTVSGTLDKAVPAAFRAAKDYKTPVVLLSPAAASFDQFKNFEERGQIFIQEVKNLKEYFLHADQDHASHAESR